MGAATMDPPATDGKPEELRNEAGEPTGAMPESPPADPLPDVDEIRVDGTAQLRIFDVGGKKATSSTLTLTGGKVKLVDGEAFRKGDRIRVTLEAVVHDVGQKDETHSKTGLVVSCEQRHKARIVDMRVDSAS